LLDAVNGEDDTAEAAAEAEAVMRKPFKQSQADFNIMFDKLVAPDREGLKLNCKSTAGIEFFPCNFSDEYKTNLNERRLLKWSPGDGDGIELRDPQPNGSDSAQPDSFNLASPPGGSFLFHTGGVIPGVQV
jgi:hypothetical protein